MEDEDSTKNKVFAVYICRGVTLQKKTLRNAIVMEVKKEVCHLSSERDYHTPILAV
jgi:hypothetical protein